MSVGLLDVNFLIGMLDPSHPHHDPAHLWFERNHRVGWATTPITINGVIRILSSSHYPSFRVSPLEVVEHLRRFCERPGHRFWSDTTNLLDATAARPELISGPSRVTDISLLALAYRNGGKLVTFDRSIAIRAVIGATARNLEVLS